MTEIDDTTQRRGRKKRSSGRETQHSIYVDPDLWDAAGNLPEPRPEIVRQAFLDKIAYYQSDLPKLKWQLEDIKAQVQSLLSKEAVIIARIEELEAKAVIDINESEKTEERRELAVKETLTMCKAFKKNMGYSQYTKLEELSGVDAAKIEAFLIDVKHRPSEEEVRIFYKG